MVEMYLAWPDVGDLRRTRSSLDHDEEYPPGVVVAITYAPTFRALYACRSALASDPASEAMMSDT